MQKIMLISADEVSRSTNQWHLIGNLFQIELLGFNAARAVLGQSQKKLHEYCIVLADGKLPSKQAMELSTICAHIGISLVRLGLQKSGVSFDFSPAGSGGGESMSTCVEPSSSKLQISDIVLDLSSFRAWKGNEELLLVPKEFALLAFFMQNPDRVFSSETLLQQIWRKDGSSTNALRSTLRRLRRKMGEEEGDSVIQNIHGIGYRMSTPRRMQEAAHLDIPALSAIFIDVCEAEGMGAVVPVGQQEGLRA